MTVQNIIQHIEQETDAEIKKLEVERDKAIYEIEKEFEKKLDSEKDALAKKVEANKDRIKRRAETYANMENRNAMLQAKRDMLQLAFDKSVKALSNSNSYKSLLVHLLKKAHKEFKEGTVIPAKGKEDITKKAIEESGAKFDMAKSSAPIAGGFILKSGKIEINFAFESILKNELWGELEMDLNKLLF